VDGVEGISFADDVGWWVSGKDIGEIRRKIEKCASLSRHWAQNNAVVFDIDKTEIVLLSRRRKMNRASKEGIQVAPGITKSFNSHATRWLGVWIDSHLSLKEHHNTMMSKAYRAEARVRSLEESSAYHLRMFAKSRLQLYKQSHYMGRNYGGMRQRIIPELLIIKNWLIDNLDQSQEC
jgi:hypothetical protein